MGRRRADSEFQLKPVNPIRELLKDKNRPIAGFATYAIPIGSDGYIDIRLLLPQLPEVQKISLIYQPDLIGPKIYQNIVNWYQRGVAIPSITRRINGYFGGSINGGNLNKDVKLIYDSQAKDGKKITGLGVIDIYAILWHSYQKDKPNVRRALEGEITVEEFGILFKLWKKGLTLSDVMRYLPRTQVSVVKGLIKQFRYRLATEKGSQRESQRILEIDKLSAVDQRIAQRGKLMIIEGREAFVLFLDDALNTEATNPANDQLGPDRLAAGLMLPPDEDRRSDPALLSDPTLLSKVKTGVGPKDTLQPSDTIAQNMDSFTFGLDPGVVHALSSMPDDEAEDLCDLEAEIDQLAEQHQTHKPEDADDVPAVDTVPDVQPTDDGSIF